MDFSRFFIDRPIFAAVLSILIFITGLIAIPLLPVSEYPDVVPPSVQVRAEYPGANPKVIAETVATPLEEAINGVENMMYMKSVAGSDGVLVTTVTFRPGTDPDQAQVQVQNRVAQAEARLPEDVRRLGITTQKQSPTLTLVVHLFSPNGKYDSLYMRNYATLKVKDELARLPGVGQIQIFGSGEYAMRVWLDPNKVAARGLTASDVVTAMQEQNVQVSAGQLGAEPLPQESDFLISINAQGRLHTEEEFGNIILKTAQDGSLVRLRDVARIEMGSGSYALRSQLNNKDAVGIGIFQSPGANAIDLSNAVRAKMAELATPLPGRYEMGGAVRPDGFRARLHPRGGADAAGSSGAGGAGGDPVPADLARVDYPIDRRAGIGGGYLQHSLSAGLLAEYPEPVRAGTGYRYRGGRRHRGGGER
ncbi:multidrug efflux pump subunit AcrB [Klebsiella variicola]|nr:multidrug efflux pump subunit AcrB [Klebsiella variicola]